MDLSRNFHFGRIASYRGALAALDKLPMERFDTPVLRAQWVNIYGAVIEGLTNRRAFDGLAALCRRAIAVLEPIYQAEPRNQTYRIQLVRTYDEARNAVLNSGQIVEALEMAQKAAPLFALAPVKNAAFWSELAGVSTTSPQRMACLMTFQNPVTAFLACRAVRPALCSTAIAS
jgi:hypothetical protein